MEHKSYRTVLERLSGILLRPNAAFAGLSPRQGESFGIVAALLVTSCVWSALDAAYSKGAVSAVSVSGAVLNTFLGTLAGWLGLAALLYLAGHALKGWGRFEDFLLWLGYAALPMVLLNLVSLLVFGVSPVLFPALGGAGWNNFHTALGVLGLVWGWPGLLSYFALRHGMRLPARQAALVIGALLAFILFGSLLPVMFPARF